MQTEIVISGFGGQGALFAGKLLAYAAMDEGKHVTWLPSYGPEMRGGTAHCIVIISDDEIGAPLVRNPAIVVAMNHPSLVKYEPLVKAEGLLVLNQSLALHTPDRDDIDVVLVPATTIADQIGDLRLTNIVMLGAMLEMRPVVSVLTLEEVLKRQLPEHRQYLLSSNLFALQRGQQAAVASEEGLLH